MELVAHPLAEAAERHADSPAIIGPHETLTYADWWDRSRDLAQRLLNEGLQPGDVLAIAMAPSERYILLLTACFHARIIACPVNPAWPLSRVAEALEYIGCRWAVTDLPYATAFSACRNIDSAALDSLPAAPDIALPALDVDSPATLIFTSGSSGSPKAALLSFGNHFYNATASNQRVPYRHGDRWLLSLPLFHVSGIAVLFRTMVAAATVVVPKDTRNLVEAIDTHRITHISVVPTQLQRLIDVPFGAPRLEKLRAILLGGSAIPGTLVRECVRLNLNVHLTYGMTETASQIATTPADADMHALFSGARPLFPEYIAVSGDGEIWVRGPILFLGYYTRGAVTRPLIDGAWFPTGDIGRFDSDGNLMVTGRKDNLFISGGENIYPEEIERALCRLVGVKRAVVVPVDDATYGQRPVAFIEPRQLVEEDPDGIRAALTEHLPRHAVPVACYGWPEEEDGAMKIDRAAFKKWAARLRERDTTRE